MLSISFLTLLLVAINYHCKQTLCAPTLENDYHLTDHTLIKMPFEARRDPIGEIPGEALSPEDFNIAELLTLEPPFQNLVGGSSSGQNGLFEGDIVGVLNQETPADAGISGILNNAVVDMTLTWPSGTIPYVLSASFGNSERIVIAKAILEFHKKTCIRFVSRTNQNDYVNIVSANGCYSYVGRVEGGQQISLGKGCISVGIILHELMHAVGFWHEQSRTDRDDYIIIHWENIIEGKDLNFQKHDLGQIQYLGEPYNTGSIMHYGAYDFAKDLRYPTITSKKDDGQQLGQREGFSNSDILKLNRLYKCETNSTIPPPTTEPPFECLDKHEYCKIWAMRGECETNSSWMKIHCQQSCNQCGGNTVALVWNGDGTDIRWSLQCDFIGRNFKIQISPANQCGPLCKANYPCSHFTWTNFNGGTCWMKSGSVSEFDAVSKTTDGAVCGFLNSTASPPASAWNDEGSLKWALNCDFLGRDLMSVASTAATCGPKCQSNPQCSHFTWTNYQGGTCWLKTNGASDSDAVVKTDSGAVCGFLKR